MAKDSRRKARAGTTSRSVAKEVVACLAAHTGLPQADFRNKHKVKRFAAGGKRRGAVIRALLAWPALKQLALRQQDFDKAELSGKSTVGDIIGIISAAAKAAKAPAKKKAAKKRTSTLDGNGTAAGQGAEDGKGCEEGEAGRAEQADEGSRQEIQGAETSDQDRSTTTHRRQRRSGSDCRFTRPDQQACNQKDNRTEAAARRRCRHGRPFQRLGPCGYGLRREWAIRQSR
jgi:hypothetical protein